jgi:ATP-dependent protease HslVU (ClpYQ) peptidase subunit
MTCIVAVERDGKVYMGGDSMASSGWDMSQIAFRKIFKTSNLFQDFIIGYSTSFRMGQLLEHELVLPKREDESDMRYMVSKFIPAVRDLLKNNGFTKIENNVEEGGSFLVGYKGKVYRIENDFQVMRHANGLYAIGCGYAYALGSLATNKSPHAEEMIMCALRVAGEFSNGVCEPYYVLSL